MGAALGLALHPALPAGAQSSGTDRIYAESQREVERAVGEVRATAKGRLPTLEGFVGTTEEPLERYRSGFYECAIKVSEASSGGTAVRVVAKITAWYTDANPAKSGYRTLPSNGRLENDLLDRLGEILEPGGTAGAAGTPPAASKPQQPSPLVPFRAPDPGLSEHPAPYRAAPAPAPAPGGTGREAARGDAGGSGNPAATEADRARAEQHTKELRDLEQNLEEVLRNQAHPENLAAVRKSGTPVYSKPQAGAQVLFSAEAQDEFQILEVQPSWVHVQISGASRGWIRRAQLELPGGLAEGPAKAGEATAAASAVFRVTRESVSRFAGDWAPLRGKTVKVFDVEPSAGMATSAREKRAFAKSLLAGARLDSPSGAEPPAGVVVVFDSSDGGQISTTRADLEQLRAARITEAEFWHRCSLDPPEAFEDSGKP